MDRLPARRAAAKLLTLAVLTVSCRLPGVVDAQPVADGVTVVTLDLVDTSRPTTAAPGVPAAASRSLPTTVHVPPGTGATPLIVLAHGAAGAPEKFTELASAWAARGYVVAAPRFP